MRMIPSSSSLLAPLPCQGEGDRQGGKVCSCILERAHPVLWLHGRGGGPGRGGEGGAGEKQRELRVIPPPLLCGSPQKNVTVDRAL